MDVNRMVRSMIVLAALLGIAGCGHVQTMSTKDCVTRLPDTALRAMTLRRSLKHTLPTRHSCGRQTRGRQSISRIHGNSVPVAEEGDLPAKTDPLPPSPAWRRSHKARQRESRSSCL